MSKQNRYGDDMAELRAMVPKRLLEVFDAIAITRLMGINPTVQDTCQHVDGDGK